MSDMQQTINKETREILNFYSEMGFNLTKVSNKQPVLPNWNNLVNKSPKVWLEWLQEGYGLGLICGESSSVTTIDVDVDPVPEGLRMLLNNTLWQKTSKGFHYIYQYEPDLPVTRIDELKTDVMNSNRQVVVPPSTVDGKYRAWGNMIEPSKMNSELKDFILSKVGTKVNLEPLSLVGGSPVVVEGNRNNTLIKIGGVIRNWVNPIQTAKILALINQNFVTPPLPISEIEAMAKSIAKYDSQDFEQFEDKIYQYLKMTEGAIIHDIKDFTKEDRTTIDIALYNLREKEKVFKSGNRFYVLNKVEWKQDFHFEQGKAVPFKMPYFDEVAQFCWGDMILLGGKPSVGKCISSGYILTNKGMIDISSVGKHRADGVTKMGLHLRVHSGQKKSKTCRKPKYFYKEMVSKTIKVTTDRGFELEGTTEHPIMVKGVNGKSGFKKLEDIIIGDYVMLTSPNIFSLSDYPLDYKIKINRHATNVKPLLIPSRITNDIASLLGYFIGDGTMGENYINIFCDSQYVDIVEHIKTIGINLGISPVIKIDGNMTIVKFHSFMLTTLVKKILSLKMKVINLPSPERVIPMPILRSTRSKQKMFIEALFSCESWMGKSGLGITMASKELIEQLLVMLLNFGVVAKKTMKYNKKYNRNYYNLYFTNEMTVKFFDIFTPKKYVGLKLNNIQRITRPIKRQSNQTGICFYYDRIVKKEELNESKYVYDFNLDSKWYKKANQFWSNGFISHNTTIAMNIVKQLSVQGVVPYYINLESGSRFGSTATRLGLRVGDLHFTTHSNPQAIELEKDAVTIVDWLLIDEKYETDKVFKHFSEQLKSKGGVLILFQQLRDNNQYYAHDMVKQFPSFAARYIYDDENKDREFGAFKIDKNREPKGRWVGKLPCRYDRDTMVLDLIDTSYPPEMQVVKDAFGAREV